MSFAARLRFAATLIVALLGFALTLDATEPRLLDEPLAMQTPQR